MTPQGVVRRAPDREAAGNHLKKDGKKRCAKIRRKERSKIEGNRVQFMKTRLGVLVIFPLAGLFSCSSLIIEETVYEDRPHFKIVTATATYCLDKAGGGMSRIIDADGTDWVAYRGRADASVPEGAAGGFRGLPNFVFRSDDGGAGHPGFDQCISEKVDARTIRTRSKSGKWAWSWKFYDDHVRLTMEKADPAHAYWFLYEGPVAGSFNPRRKYWGTDLGGPRGETPSLNHGESIEGNWQWAYFGDQETERVLFIAQEQPDEWNDLFAYMGSTAAGKEAADGMVVFGFGRGKGAVPLMKATGVVFRIGFIDRKIVSPDDHEWIKQEIESKNTP